MTRLFHTRLASWLLFACILPYAEAHAILISSTPTAGAHVSGPEADVKLRFNSRVDSKRSSLVLVAPNGQRETLQINAQSPPDSLTSHVKGLKAGPYTLRWQVLAIDGHITRGEVPFAVR